MCSMYIPAPYNQDDGVRWKGDGKRKIPSKALPLFLDTAAYDNSAILKRSGIRGYGDTGRRLTTSSAHSGDSAPSGDDSVPLPTFQLAGLKTGLSSSRDNVEGSSDK